MDTDGVKPVLKIVKCISTQFDAIEMTQQCYIYFSHGRSGQPVNLSYLESFGAPLCQIAYLCRQEIQCNCKIIWLPLQISAYCSVAIETSRWPKIVLNLGFNPTIMIHSAMDGWESESLSKIVSFFYFLYCFYALIIIWQKDEAVATKCYFNKNVNIVLKLAPVTLN